MGGICCNVQRIVARKEEKVLDINNSGNQNQKPPQKLKQLKTTGSSVKLRVIQKVPGQNGDYANVSEEINKKKCVKNKTTVDNNCISDKLNADQKNDLSGESKGNRNETNESYGARDNDKGNANNNDIIKIPEEEEDEQYDEEEEEDENRKRKFNDTIDDMDGFNKDKINKRDITNEEEMQIKNVFHKMFLFDVFPEEQLNEILEALFIVKIQRDDFLLNKGQKCNCFFIVSKGSLEVYDDPDALVDEDSGITRKNTCNPYNKEKAKEVSGIGIEAADLLEVPVPGNIQKKKSNIKKARSENKSDWPKVIRTYNQWDSFGYTSLMNQIEPEKIKNPIKATSDCELFALSGEIFIAIKEMFIKHRFDEKLEYLNTIIFFKGLDVFLKHAVAEKLNLINVKKGTKIISKGDKTKTIYCIKQGSVKCVYNNKEKNNKILGVSSYFGIVSLLTNSKRTMDVIACEDTELYELDEISLKASLGPDYINVLLLHIFKEYISSNSIFSELINHRNIDAVFKKFKLKRYVKNEKINGENPNLKRILLVLEGSFVNCNTMSVAFSAGSLIGEETLANNLDIPTYLIAVPDCLTFEANLADIDELLGEDFRATTMHLLQRVIKMQRMPFFNAISENTLKLIMSQIKKEKFFPGQPIMEEGSEGSKYYIIAKGTCQVSIRGVKIRVLEKMSCFGERALLYNARNLIDAINKNEAKPENPNMTSNSNEDLNNLMSHVIEISNKEKPKTYGTGNLFAMNNSSIMDYNRRTATVTALTNVHCYVLKKKEFLLAYMEPQVQYLINTQIELQNSSINLRELKVVNTCGHGKFGAVSLVHNNRYLYAIKAIARKDADRRRKIASYIVNERHILLSLDHPFITRTVKSFKNENYVFFLMEYINGQTLKELIRDKKHFFSKDDIKFYIASLLLIADYIHKKKIIQRDIKPGNIMIDERGYVKMIDFGTSKYMVDYTNTLIGTPHYMAPEILSGKGYTFSCDYWSIGVTAFEMFYNTYPFGNDATDQLEVYNEILYGNLVIPNDCESFEDINEFLTGILNKQVYKRLCSLTKIQNLAFFDEFDWEQLVSGKIKAPLTPFVNKDLFGIKFEDYSDNYEREANNNVDFRMGSMRKGDLFDPSWADEF